MNASPAAFSRRAPSPRSASDSRKRGRPGTSRTVGWNWTNSRSATSAPASNAMAMPSPVVTVGLVVWANTCPAPPVASNVDAGPHDVPRVVCVTIRGPDAAPALAQQFGDDRVVDDRDGRQRRHLPVQHAADLAPGGVLGVQHAADAVGRLARRRRPAIGVAIEARAPVQQLRDVGGTFLDERAHRVRLAEPVTGGERVLEVQARRIVVAHGHGDATLRPPRAALFRLALREDADLPPARERQRRAERSDAAAEYQEIGVRGHQTLLSYHPLRARLRQGYGGQAGVFLGLFSCSLTPSRSTPDPPRCRAS